MLGACGGNEAEFQRLYGRQVILPRDFWNPVDFKLDPKFHWMHLQHGDKLTGR